MIKQIWIDQIRFIGVVTMFEGMIGQLIAQLLGKGVFFGPFAVTMIIVGFVLILFALMKEE